VRFPTFLPCNLFNGKSCDRTVHDEALALDGVQAGRGKGADQWRAVDVEARRMINRPGSGFVTI
jgi:hypothetical protein